MNKETKELLEKKVPGKWHDKVLEHCKKLVKRSRADMSKFYGRWDAAAKSYEAEKASDRQDRQSRETGEPVKMVVPLTTAQVDTFIAFAFSVLHQKQRLFELEPTGEEDAQLREVSELVLKRDVQESGMLGKEYQLLKDVARFGLGVFKVGWREEKVRLPVVMESLESLLGEEEVDEDETTWEEFTKYEGNKVDTVSPYLFFPDTRLSLGEFQDGEFCACDVEYSLTTLKKMEGAGEVAGTEFVDEFGDEDRLFRERHSRFASIDLGTPEGSLKKGVLCVTECQVWIVPDDFKVEGEKNLFGEGKVPVLYLVWYVNDGRIVKLEPVTSVHNKFSFSLAELKPDKHHLVNRSLVNELDKLQGAIDWFINSRMESVRRTLSNQLVVDPSVVDMASLEGRSRVIRLQRGVARAGIERYIKPLPVMDVTARHMDDAGVLTRMAQSMTGVNDNMTGQYHTGRRSATESQAVTQGSSSRIVAVVGLIWESAYVPVANMMLSNARQIVGQDQFVKAVGEDKAEVYEVFAGDIEGLVGSQDMFVFDGTLPSAKMYLAQSLQELLGIVLQNPEAAQMFGLDPRQLLEEIYVLRGLGNLKRFQPRAPDGEGGVTPEVLEMIMQQQLMQQQGGAV